jgi:hypothetical protein
MWSFLPHTIRLLADTFERTPKNQDRAAHSPGSHTTNPIGYPIARTIESDLIQNPCRGIEKRKIAHSVLICHFVASEDTRKASAARFSGVAFLPISLDRIPELQKAPHRMHYQFGSSLRILPRDRRDLNLQCASCCNGLNPIGPKLTL